VEVKSEDISIDNLDPMEVVIRTETSLVSAGTELARLNGMEAGTGFPVRPGYASVGTILAKGSGVGDFNIGDRVFYAGKHCEIQRFLHGQDHQWGRLYPVPAGIPSADAVFVCLAEIALVAPVLSELTPGDTVAVFGLGVIGNLAAQIYRNLGARVIGLDPVAKRCALAEKAGIDITSSCPASEQVATVKKLTDNHGAAITVDAVGHSAIIRNCIQATSLFGQIMLLGTPRAPLTGELTDVFLDIHSRGLVVRGAHMWQFPAFDVRGVKKTVPWAYRMLFDWMKNGRLEVGLLRSHIAKPAEAPRIYEGLQNARDQYWGVVFDWS